jgi:hypothetical protein
MSLSSAAARCATLSTIKEPPMPELDFEPAVSFLSARVPYVIASAVGALWAVVSIALAYRYRISKRGLMLFIIGTWIFGPQLFFYADYVYHAGRIRGDYELGRDAWASVTAILALIVLEK